MKQPVISPPKSPGALDHIPHSSNGQSFHIFEWQGSGPSYMHVHFEDDEAWVVLEGEINFQFSEGAVKATPGTTVFVPAGVPHTYTCDDSTRYLIILTTRLKELIAELHNGGSQDLSEILSKYKSALV